MLNKKFLNKIRELLFLQKSEVLTLSQQERDIDTEGDETDVIQGNILIELNNRLSTRAASKLLQIEEALQRIENKTYGLCQDCEESIPEKRLLLNPHFQTCVSCAEDREAEERQRRRF
jgi:DnaK suppressor protein